MKALRYLITAFLSVGALIVPNVALAAGGKADLLIHVADTRVVTNSYTIFFLDLYNKDPFMFGLWCSIITAGLGVSLGLITDQIMKRTGIDLSKRTIVEH